MKVIKMLMVAVLFTTAFIGCSKDKAKAPFTIEGVWKGNTGNGGFFGLNIKQGGGLDRISSGGTVSASGSWQLTGNTLTGNYNYANGTQVQMTATVDVAKNQISGSWSNNGGETGSLLANKSE